MKLSAARLFVREIGPALAFYRDVLGLPLQADGSAQGYAVFDCGGVRLVVEAVPADAPVDEQALVGRFAGLSFAVADVDAEHRRLAALGARFTGAPEQQFWGGWLATFCDPAGNELQLVQDPA
jgi:predicted enzyme related to lactoylglutathione lyase